MDYISSLKAVMGTVPPVTRLQPYISAAEASTHPALPLLELLEKHLDAVFWRVSSLGSMAQDAAALRNFCNADMLALPEILGQLEAWTDEFPFLTGLLNVTGLSEPLIRNAYLSESVCAKLVAYVAGHTGLPTDRSVTGSMELAPDGLSVTATAKIQVVMSDVKREVVATVVAHPFPDTMRAFIDIGETLFEFFCAQLEPKLLAPEFRPTAAERAKASRDEAYHASCDILNTLSPADRDRLRSLLAFNQSIFMMAARKVL